MINRLIIMGILGVPVTRSAEDAEGLTPAADLMLSVAAADGVADPLPSGSAAGHPAVALAVALYLT